MSALARHNAAAAAERLLKEHDIDALPVDVMAIAEAVNVTVMRKHDAKEGVSGVLVKIGNNFAIAYATHIQSEGFRRFSIAHELGHLHLEGHADALLPIGDTMHQSRAGFQSDDPYEREADHFAANLLMPRSLFRVAMRTAGNGLAAIESLADTCGTSRLATAIRYTQETEEPVAIVVSEGQTLCYAFLSDELKEFREISWPRKNSALPDVPTAAFNQSAGKVKHAERSEHETSLSDWFGGSRSVPMTEEILGLGQYGRTLTVLTGKTYADDEDEDADLEESWMPRFR